MPQNIATSLSVHRVQIGWVVRQSITKHNRSVKSFYLYFYIEWSHKRTVTVFLFKQNRGKSVQGKKTPLHLLLWFIEPLTVDISVLFEKPCLKRAGTSYFSSWVCSRVCDITLRSVFTQNRWRGREGCLSDETLWDCGDGQIQSTYTVGEKIFSSAISITPWELIRAVLRVMSQRTKCCSSLNQNNSAFVCCFFLHYTMDAIFLDRVCCYRTNNIYNKC